MPDRFSAPGQSPSHNSGWRAHLFNQPYVLLTLAALFWAGNAIVGRAVHAEIPPIGLAFWRWFFAFWIMVPIAWPFLMEDWQRIIRYWPIILLLSSLGVASFGTLLYQGLQFTTAINALLIQSAMPLGVVVVSFLLFRDRLTILQAIGVVISFVGAVVIVSQGDWHILSTLSFNVGDLLILIAVAGYAVYTTLLRLRPALHPLSFLTTTFAFGALLLAPLYFWETNTGRTMSLNFTTVCAVAYIALFPSILAYLFYNRGVELAGANRAGLFIHLIPVFGSIMATIFLGEMLQWFHGLGFVLILIGIALVIRKQALSN